MTHYLITGGAGFIGSNIAHRLVGMGETVSIYDNLSTGRTVNLAKISDKIHFIQADILDTDTLTSSMEGVDYVIHQAAIPSVPRSVDDPKTSIRNNIDGTLEVLLAARSRGVKRVVFASSSSVYGTDPSNPKKEHQPTLPKSPYALSKLTGEHLCRLFFDLYGLETVALRYFNVFGPRQNPSSQYAAVIPAFIDAIVKNRPPTIHSDGEQSRDFTYVENVVDANLLACSAPAAAGQVFNIGCHHQTTVNELFACISRILRSNLIPHYAPERQGDVRHSYADIEKARGILGYQSRFPFDQGIEETIRFLTEMNR